jgi:hypothetical protein
MNSRYPAFVLLLAIWLALTPLLHAQDTDKDVDDAIQQAADAAKKMGVKMPDVKKQPEEVDKEEAKQKAALQKQLEAPGPVALPDWTPKVPQFKPTGPAAKGDKLNSSRSNNSTNDTKTVFIYLSTREEPLQKVVLEATRGPEEKITHVMISSPLPKPEVEED